MEFQTNTKLLLVLDGAMIIQRFPGRSNYHRTNAGVATCISRRYSRVAYVRHTYNTRHCMLADVDRFSSLIVPSRRCPPACGSAELILLVAGRREQCSLLLSE
jgi:hypothetical protein